MNLITYLKTVKYIHLKTSVYRTGDLGTTKTLIFVLI